MHTVREGGRETVLKTESKTKPERAKSTEKSSSERTEIVQVRLEHFQKLNFQCEDMDELYKTRRTQACSPSIQKVHLSRECQSCRRLRVPGDVIFDMQDGQCE